MTVNVAAQIEEILALRASRAALLRKRLGSWEALRDQIRGLTQALTELTLHPSASESVRLALEELLEGRDPTDQIDREVIPRLQRVEQRFARSRLNIGVAGMARVGKSTLLQAISGLGDGQIPTGDDLPVTAVRSRIFHSSSARAIISFHTWDSFRTDVLRPYFERLKWGAPPSPPAGFRRYEPSSQAGSSETAAVDSALRDRVRGMIASFDTYESLLTGDTQTLPLDKLRGFVAYPSSTEEVNGRPLRKYLAVREVVIEYPFPGTLNRPGF